VATVYHYALGWTAPYALPSLPKLLGVAGGVSLLVGSCGLAWLHLHRHPDHGDRAQRPMDLGFITLLALISATGLLLWLLGSTAAMPLMLAIHLGTVMALFLTLPYGKFAHGIFRTAALLRFAVEKRQPNRLGLGGE
jgi:citrate/tricarballylate utilization protein